MPDKFGGLQVLTAYDIMQLDWALSQIRDQSGYGKVTFYLSGGAISHLEMALSVKKSDGQWPKSESTK
jgi:hypothetical protein